MIRSPKGQFFFLGLVLSVYSSDSSPFPRSSRITGTSSSSRQGSEERQRGHLEYREEEKPRDIIQKMKDKDVPIPNLPIPKSSDGDVRIRFTEN